jgi:hypothetical protein|tara:strand:+ start:3615 stop:3896 length:282 start_codon:yes stop_codon:yes gene_type:complete
VKSFFKDLLTALIFALIAFLMLVWVGAWTSTAYAKDIKSKFYDFNEQLIDGQIKKPTILYTSVREKTKFDRLLRLKKSFLNKLFKTSKEKVFK